MKMDWSNKLWLWASGFMISYWILQFSMLGLFGVGYCARKSFLGCILPIVYLIPLMITLIVFVPIYYFTLKDKTSHKKENKK